MNVTKTGKIWLTSIFSQFASILFPLKDIQIQNEGTDWKARM